MKKLIYILAGFSICFASCKKFLNTEPTDFVSEQKYYSTESGLTAALAGVYQPLANGAIYGGKLYNKLNYINDEACYRWGFGLTNVENNVYDAGNADVYDAWKQLYNGVERANILLSNIDASPVDAAKKNVIIGETRFLRAYYYFLLVTTFGDVPLKTEKSTDPMQLQQARTPAKEVYSFILKEMEAAIPMVKKSAEWGFSGRVSQTVIKGIMARVCLARAGVTFAREGDSKTYYELALKWAKDVISGQEHRLLETYDSAIANNSAYAQVFITECQNKYNIAETMWEVEFSGDGTDGRGNQGPLGNNPGITWQNGTNQGALAMYGYNYNYTNVAPTLFQLYEAGDLRRYWAIANFTYNQPSAELPEVPLAKYYNSYSATGNNAAGQVGKWRREMEGVASRAFSNNTSINFPLLRYSDVLLMAAEAENELNGPANAYQYINQVRRRAFGVSVNTASSTPFVGPRFITASGGAGYKRTAPVALTFTTATGSGAVLEASVNQGSGAITGVEIKAAGAGYPIVNQTITFPNPWGATDPANWVANTAYKVDDYVRVLVSGTTYRYYHVSKAGISSAAAPSHTTGKANNGTAEFEFASKAGNGTVIMGSTTIDLAGLSSDSFRQAVKDERSRELCFEGLRTRDLIRWGDFLKARDAVKALLPASHTSATGYNNLSERNLLLPIPSAEIANNGLLIQNPGW